MSHKTRKLLMIGAVSLIASTNVFSQSVDALLHKLVEKGVLSQSEADDLSKETKDESDKTFQKQYRKVTGMPDWVTSFKWGGDFRGRYEENNAEAADFHVRDRYRLRLRLAAYIQMLERFDIGIRLATGNPQTNPGGTLVGGSPVSANQDFNSLQSRKPVWIDAAYARWIAVTNDDWFVSGTIGKMDNPFQLSNMVWDYDIDPEGVAFKSVHHFNENQHLTANGAFFVLDELNQTNSNTVSPTHDPSIIGGQLLWESSWTPHIDTALSIAAFSINSSDALSAKSQPFYNSGNTRDAKTDTLKYHYNPIVGSAALTYKLDRFPFYTGPFPIRPSLDYMVNPAAPKNNIAYRIGVNLGKAGKKGNWEVNYRYQRLEADAWFDALLDEDNTAFFNKGNPQMTGTGKSSGLFGGTNVKGHWFAASYSFTDFLTATTFFYFNDTIIHAPKGSGEAEHFMAELNFKF